MINYTDIISKNISQNHTGLAAIENIITIDEHK